MITTTCIYISSYASQSRDPITTSPFLKPIAYWLPGNSSTSSNCHITPRMVRHQSQMSPVSTKGASGSINLVGPWGNLLNYLTFSCGMTIYTYIIPWKQKNMVFGLAV